MLRFVPQAATLTESGWIQQLILGTSSPAEASKLGRLHHKFDRHVPVVRPAHILPTICAQSQIFPVSSGDGLSC